MTLSIIFFAILSAAIGFWCAQLVAGEECGAKAKIKIVKNRVKIKDHVVHVHHWLYGSFLLMGVHHFFITHPWHHQEVFYGFLVGVVIQGLTGKNTRDFYRVVYKEEV